MVFELIKVAWINIAFEFFMEVLISMQNTFIRMQCLYIVLIFRIIFFLSLLLDL